MKNWIIGTLVCISLFIFPATLNFIIVQPRMFPVAGDDSTWLSFWPVYLSSITSFIMIVLTWCMLKQNKEQLNELRIQREEDERSRLVASIITYQAAFFLKISNIGKRNAYNVQINIDQEFIKELPPREQKLFIDLKNPFFVEADKSVYTYIGSCSDINNLWKNKTVVLKLQGHYNDKYEIVESFDMNEFIGKIHFIVKGDLETTIGYIKEGLVVQNNSYMPIQKSLDNIAKILNKYDSGKK